jgi:hypothetical protein
MAETIKLTPTERLNDLLLALWLRREIRELAREGGELMREGMTKNWQLKVQFYHSLERAANLLSAHETAARIEVKD